MMKNCSNGRPLLVTDIESAARELETSWIPFVVLLTVWSIGSVKAEGLSDLIKLLLAKGVKTFVCIGYYSESLHDEIDEIIYEYAEEHDISAASEIITTYHDDEPVDDVVNYFVHGTEIPETESGGLLAILGDGDKEVEASLKKAQFDVTKGVVETDKFGNVISRTPKSIQDKMTLDAAKRGEGIVKIDNLGDPKYAGMQKMELEIISTGGKNQTFTMFEIPQLEIRWISNLKTIVLMA